MLDSLENRRKIGWKKIYVEPAGTEVVGLGVYGNHEPEPKFDLKTIPVMGDELGLSVEKLDLQGKPEYLLLYILHNFGDIPCSVTLRRLKD